MNHVLPSDFPKEAVRTIEFLRAQVADLSATLELALDVMSDDAHSEFLFRFAIERATIEDACAATSADVANDGGITKLSA